MVNVLFANDTRAWRIERLSCPSRCMLGFAFYILLNCVVTAKNTEPSGCLVEIAQPQTCSNFNRPGCGEPQPLR